jgi:hypothetical protein
MGARLALPGIDNPYPFDGALPISLIPSVPHQTGAQAQRCRSGQRVACFGDASSPSRPRSLTSDDILPQSQEMLYSGARVVPG